MNLFRSLYRIYLICGKFRLSYVLVKYLRKFVALYTHHISEEITSIDGFKAYKKKLHINTGTKEAWFPV